MPYDASLNIAFTLNTASLENVKNQAQRMVGDLTGKVSIKIDNSSLSQLQALSRTTKELQKNVSTLNSTASSSSSGMNSLAASLGTIAVSTQKVNTQYLASTRTLSDMGVQYKEAGAAAERFGQLTGLAARRFLAFSIGAGAVVTMVAALKSGVTEALKFDLAMNKLKQVSDDGIGAISSINKEITRLSTSLGVSSGELAETAVTLQQAGFRGKETAQVLETIAKADLAPNFKDMKQTTEGVIAVFSQFGRNVNKIRDDIGAMNAVAGAFAVEAQDLIVATQKAGGSFASMGNSIEELLALFTSVRSATRESSQEVATGLRTIFARVQRGDTIQQLKDLGIELRYTAEEAKQLGDVDLKNQFVGAYEAAGRLAEALSQVRSTDPRFSSIVEELGGVRQISRVIPLLKNYSEAQKALNIAKIGATSIDIAAEQRQDAIANKIDKVKERFLAFSRELVQSQGFKDFVDVLENGAYAAIRILDNLKPLLPLLAGLATVKISRELFGFVAGAPNFISGLGNPGKLTNPEQSFKMPRRFSSGGIVPGSGSGDTVPAYLEPGEFVIKKDSAMKMGYGKLKELNVKGYASGGIVTKENIDKIIKEYSDKAGVDFSSLIDDVGIEEYITKTIGDSIYSARSKYSYNQDNKKSSFSLSELEIQDEKSLREAILYQLGVAYDYKLGGGSQASSMKGTKAYEYALKNSNLQRKYDGYNYNGTDYGKFKYSRENSFANVFRSHFLNDDTRESRKSRKGFGSLFDKEKIPDAIILPEPYSFNEKDIERITSEYSKKTGIDFSKIASFEIKDEIAGKIGDKLVSSYGAYNNKTKTIKLSRKTINSEELLRSTLLHELGHGIDYLLGDGQASSLKTDSLSNRYAKKEGALAKTYAAQEGQTFISEAHKKYLFSEKESFANLFRSYLLNDDSLESKFQRRGFSRLVDEAAIKTGGQAQSKGLSTRLGRLLSIGKLSRYATGDKVEGVGDGDTVPSLLTPGEFVIKKDSVNKVGLPILRHINQTGEMPKGFNKGGLVSDDNDDMENYIRNFIQNYNARHGKNPDKKLVQQQIQLFNKEKDERIKLESQGVVKGIYEFGDIQDRKVLQGNRSRTFKNKNDENGKDSVINKATPESIAQLEKDIQEEAKKLGIELKKYTPIITELSNGVVKFKGFFQEVSETKPRKVSTELSDEEYESSLIKQREEIRRFSLNEALQGKTPNPTEVQRIVKLFEDGRKNNLLDVESPVISESNFIQEQVQKLLNEEETVNKKGRRKKKEVIKTPPPPTTGPEIASGDSPRYELPPEFSKIVSGEFRFELGKMATELESQLKGARPTDSSDFGKILRGEFVPQIGEFSQNLLREIQVKNDVVTPVVNSENIPTTTQEGTKKTRGIGRKSPKTFSIVESLLNSVIQQRLREQQFSENFNINGLPTKNSILSSEQLKNLQIGDETKNILSTSEPFDRKNPENLRSIFANIMRGNKYNISQAQDVLDLPQQTSSLFIPQRNLPAFRLSRKKQAETNALKELNEVLPESDLNALNLPRPNVQREILLGKREIPNLTKLESSLPSEFLQSFVTRANKNFNQEGSNNLSPNIKSLNNLLLRQITSFDSVQKFLNNNVGPSSKITDKKFFSQEVGKKLTFEEINNKNRISSIGYVDFITQKLVEAIKESGGPRNVSSERMNSLLVDIENNLKSNLLGKITKQEKTRNPLLTDDEAKNLAQDEINTRGEILVSGTGEVLGSSKVGRELFGQGRNPYVNNRENLPPWTPSSNFDIEKFKNGIRTIGYQDLVQSRLRESISQNGGIENLSQERMSELLKEVETKIAEELNRTTTNQYRRISPNATPEEISRLGSEFTTSVIKNNKDILLDNGKVAGANTLGEKLVSIGQSPIATDEVRTKEERDRELEEQNRQKAIEERRNRQIEDRKFISSWLKTQNLSTVDSKEFLDSSVTQKIESQGGPDRLSASTQLILAQQQEAEFHKKLVAGIERQIKAIDSTIPSSERLKIAQERAATIIETQGQILVDEKGQVVGSRDLGEDLVQQGKNARGRRSIGFGNFLKSQFRDSGTGAFATSAALGVAASGIEPSTFVEGGNVGNYTARNAASGALAGAGIGLGIGAMFGPWGMAIGAASGALIGLVKSINDAAKNIRDAKLGDSVTKFVDRLDDLSKGRANIGDGGESRASENIRRSIGLIYEKSVEEATGTFGGLDGKEADLLFKKNLRKDLGGSLGGIANELNRSTEQIIRKNPKASQEDILNTLNSGFNGELLSLVAKLRDIPLSQVLREYSDSIKGIQRGIKVEENLRNMRLEIDRAANDFGRLTAAVQNSITSLDDMDIRSQSLSNSFSGGVGGIRGRNFEQILNSVGTNSPEFTKLAGKVGGLFGNAGNDLVKTNNAFDKISSILPSILTEAVKTPIGENDSLGDRVGKSLLDSLGLKDKDLAKPENSGLREIIRAIEAELNKGDPDKQNEILKGIAADPTTSAQQILNGAAGKAAFEQLSNIIKLVGENANNTSIRLQTAREQFIAINESIQKIDEITLGRRQAQATFSAQATGRNITDFISLADATEPFNNNQRRLAGNDGNNAFAIGQRLAKVTQDIEDARKIANENSLDANKSLDAQKALSGLITESNNLQTALRNLANPTQKLAAIQERLNTINQTRESRRGYADKFINSSPEEQLRMQQGQALIGEILKNPKRFGELSLEEQQLTLGSLRDLGNSKLANGQTASGLRNQLLDQALAANGGAGVLGPADAQEENNLQNEMIKVFQEAEKAQNEVAKFQKDVHQTFLTNLENIHQRFFAQLAVNLQGEEINRRRPAVGRAGLEVSRLEDAVAKRDQLRKFGFNVENDADIAKIEANKGSINTFFTERKKVDDAEKFIKGFINKDFANENFENGDLNLFKLRQSLIGAGVGTNTSERISRQIISEFAGEDGISDSIENRDRINRIIKTGVQNDFFDSKNQEKLRKDLNKSEEDIKSAFGQDTLDKLRQVNINEKSGQTLNNALTVFNPKGGNVSVNTLDEDLAKAKKSFEDLKSELDKLTKAFEDARAKLNNPQVQQGIVAEAKANGGAIFSARGTDTVPAMLTPGEFVVNRASAQANMELLKKINSSKGTRYYADGGEVVRRLGDNDITKDDDDEIRAAINFAKKLAEAQGRPFTSDEELDITIKVIQARRRREDAKRQAEEEQAKRLADVGNNLNALGDRNRKNKAKPQNNRIPTFEDRLRDNLNFNAQNMAYQQALSRTGFDNADISVGAAGLQRNIINERFNSGMSAEDRRKATQFFGGLGRGNFQTEVIKEREREKIRVKKAFAAANKKNKPSQFDRKGVIGFSNDVGGFSGAIGFANGGLVPGFGSGDSVPALLTPGEFVLNNKATRAIGSNKLALANNYANGGIVGSPQYLQSGGQVSGQSNGLDKAINDFAASSMKFVESMNGFITSANSLNSAMQLFSTSVEKMPSKIDFNGKTTVEVIFNGAEVLGSLKESLGNEFSKMIDNKIAEAFKTKIPDA